MCDLFIAPILLYPNIYGINYNGDGRLLFIRNIPC